MNNIQGLELGKLPPQAIEFEEAVLGGLMLEKQALIEIIDIIKPESFYRDSHQKIFKSALDLFSNNKGVDMLTIIEQCRVNGVIEDVGGMAYITGLTSKISSASHIEFHARIIQQKYIQRELIRISSKIQNKSYDESIDISELLNYAESELFNITQGNIKKEPKLIGDIGKEQLVLLSELQKSDKEFSGIPTGLASLDRLINGFHNEMLIIIAARPAMGKTTFIISISKNIAIYFNKNVAIFSLEMGEKELWNKYAADMTGITYTRIRDGQLNSDEWNSVESAQRQLEESNIYIDDTAGITLFELRAKARRLKMKHNIDIIFIDYLQLMSGDAKSGNREQEISTISRGLKTTAKDLEIPIVALSQLNRSVEQRPDKKPNLSDLRESGAIEQDADMVGFLHRPEEYGFTTYEDGTSTMYKLDVLIKKHRAGATGEVSLDRTSNFTRIYDKESEHISPINDDTINNDDLEKNLDF